MSISGWSDDFQVFLQRVRMMRQASLMSSSAAAPNPTIDSAGKPSPPAMAMLIDEEGEDAIQKPNNIRPNHFDYSNDQQIYDTSSVANAADDQQPTDAGGRSFFPPSADVVADGRMVKVTVGIDEDLRLILEMDPSIVDLGGQQWTQSRERPPPRVLGLPPITGG